MIPEITESDSRQVHKKYMWNLNLKSPCVPLYSQIQEFGRKIKGLKRLQALLLSPASQTLIQIGKLRPRHNKGYTRDIILRLGLGQESRHLGVPSAPTPIWNGGRSPK